MATRRFWLCCCAISFIAAPAWARDYALGAGDRLKMRVYPDSDFNVELRVSSDGQLEVPLLGPVSVAGKSVAETAELLRQKLKGDFYRDPTVELEVLEYVAHRAYVLGAVKNPGAHPIFRGDRVLDLLQRAGGLVSRGVGFAYIFERDAGAGAPTVTRVSIQRILQNADFAQNIAVPDGATIYVFEDERVFVMGAVKNPGAYDVASGNSVLRAITVAGGFSPRANSSNVMVYRGNPVVGTQVNADKIIDNSLTDPPLQPGDLVFVAERFF